MNDHQRGCLPKNDSLRSLTVLLALGAVPHVVPGQALLLLKLGKATLHAYPLSLALRNGKGEIHKRVELDRGVSTCATP